MSGNGMFYLQNERKTKVIKRGAVLLLALLCSAMSRCSQGAESSVNSKYEIIDGTGGKIKYTDMYLYAELSGSWETSSRTGNAISLVNPGVDELIVSYMCLQRGWIAECDKRRVSVEDDSVTFTLRCTYAAEADHHVTISINSRKTISLDLDCDADWDGEIEDEEDDPIEETQGALVGLGKKEPMKLKIKLNDTEEASNEIAFSVKGGIRVHVGSEGDEVVLSPNSDGTANETLVPLEKVRGLIVVEGVETSKEFGDCQVEVKYTDPSGYILSDVNTFTVVNVDVSIAGQDEETEETEGAYALFVGDFGKAPFAPRAVDYLTPVTLSLLPSDFPEELQTNVVVELEGNVEDYLYEKPEGDNPEMLEIPESYSQASNVYTLAQLKVKEFVLHGHEKSGKDMLRDKSITISETRTKVEDKGLFTVIKLNLVADYNRDHKIDEADERSMALKEPLYWWINDDADEKDCASCYSDKGTDIPGKDKNNADEVVNRCTDLLDFFSVWVDAHDAIETVGSDKIKLELLNAKGGYGVVYTKLRRNGGEGKDGADGYLFGIDVSADGDFFMQAKTHTGSPQNLADHGGFLGLIKKDPDFGILMVEGRNKGGELGIILKKNDKVIISSALPVELKNVEEMYKRVHVYTDKPAEEINYATGMDDYYTADTDVIFLHGFKVDADHARGWHSEVFKRLYRSGSNARFWGVTWDGCKDTFLLSPGLYYHEMAGDAAFSTGTYLARFFKSVKGLRGNVVVMAHSLGNMVVSSAICDKGNDWRPGKYFMLNAAVPVEAYYGRKFKPDAGDTAYHLVDEDWIEAGEEYPAESYCANWYDLFEDNDAERPWRNLTWVNRFADVSRKTKVINYYSEGDEVFEIEGAVTMASGGDVLDWNSNTIGEPDSRMIPSVVNSYAQYCWQKQELGKGLGYSVDSLFNFMFNSSWAGWKFNRSWGYYVIKDGKVVSTSGHWYTLGIPVYERTYSAEVAQDIVRLGLKDVFREKPVFNNTPEEMLSFGDPTYVKANRDQLLGFAIPALSPAMGRPYEATQEGDGWKSMPDLCMKLGRCVRAKYGQRWLHCDLKDFAYMHNYLLYDNFVENGNMK